MLNNLRLQTHTQNLQYLSLFRGNNGYTNATQFTLTVSALPVLLQLLCDLNMRAFWDVTSCWFIKPLNLVAHSNRVTMLEQFPQQYAVINWIKNHFPALHTRNYITHILLEEWILFRRFQPLARPLMLSLCLWILLLFCWLLSMA
jgi:hypothetical protein